MPSVRNTGTAVLAFLCKICPFCVSARRWPESRFAKAMRRLERACPACRALAQQQAQAPDGEYACDDVYFGRMSDPTASGTVCGPCGDTMEFYLVIRDDRIEDVRYYTDGCGNTRSCGRAVARRAKGRGVTEALAISAGEIIRSGECEPASGRHCAILAVTTLYRALADYLLTR